MKVEPRRFAHQGVVSAAAFWMSPDLAGSECEARIVALGANATTFAAENGWFVKLKEPVEIWCTAAPGLPFVTMSNGVLASLPLDADEIEALGAASGDVVIAEGAEARRLEIGERVDVSKWIDVGAFQLVTTTPLGEEIAAPKVAVPKIAVDTRKELGVGAPAEEMNEVIAALQGKKGQGAPGASGRRGPGVVANAIARTLNWIAGALGPKRSSSSSSSSSSRALGRVKPSAVAKLAAMLRRAAARLLDWTRLGTFVQRAHARYLERLFEMFDDGDFDAALRHAIPLGGLEPGLSSPALAPPGPRSNLAISPAKSPVTTSLGLGGDLFAMMRARYRAAFEKLDALGRHEEAAFVLAELLNASEEAVSYLERHDRLRLAAEIAEARNLPPGLVVRQWWIAGERKRALDIARARGAFGDAIVRLERSNPAAAESLRLAWADALADGGDYAAAVDVIWPIVAAHRVALDWIDRAIAIGGASGARMLARKIGVAPERFAEARPLALEVLAESGASGHSLRVALGSELATLPSSNEVRVIARATLRALLIDEIATPRRLLDQLEASADDPIFKADLARNREPKIAPKAAKGPRRIELCARNETGAKRSLNEDWVGVLFPSSPWIGAGDVSRELGDEACSLVLADGSSTGSTPSAWFELLSTTASRELNIRAGSAKSPPALATALQETFVEANRVLYARATTVASFRGSGCAIVAALLRGDDVAIAHAGDSRAYLFRDGRLKALTRDHSLFEELRKQSKFAEAAEVAALHPNIMTRVLGVAATIEPDCSTMKLADGDCLLLVSDGVHRNVPDAAIEALLTANTTSLSSVGEAIVGAVEAAGAPDNFSFILARVGGDLQAQASAKDDAIVRAANDAGAMPIFDAVALPRGRLLVALGEAGARLLGPTGNVIAHFLEPAHHLVASEHGDRALSLGKRGEAFRIARIDLVRRRAEPWCDARLSAFSPTFDGTSWLVGEGEKVFLIDVLDQGWRSLWSIEEPGASVVRVVAAGDNAAIHFSGGLGRNAEVWMLDKRVLRRRRQLESSMMLTAISAGGSLLGARVDEDPRIIRDTGSGWVPGAVFDSSTRLLEGAIDKSSWAFAEMKDGACRIHLESAAGATPTRIILEGATEARIRFFEGRAIVSDDRGRVLVIDEAGTVEREWRSA